MGCDFASVFCLLKKGTETCEGLHKSSIKKKKIAKRAVDKTCSFAMAPKTRLIGAICYCVT